MSTNYLIFKCVSAYASVLKRTISLLSSHWYVDELSLLCEINKNNLTIVCALSYDTLVTFFTFPEQPDSERTSSVCHRLFVPVLKHETILFFGGFSGNQSTLSRAPKTGSETELSTCCVWAKLWNLTTVREIENITRLIQDQFTEAVKSSHHLLHRDGSQVTRPQKKKHKSIHILCHDESFTVAAELKVSACSSTSTGRRTRVHNPPHEQNSETSCFSFLQYHRDPVTAVWTATVHC